MMNPRNVNKHRQKRQSPELKNQFPNFEQEKKVEKPEYDGEIVEKRLENSREKKP